MNATQMWIAGQIVNEILDKHGENCVAWPMLQVVDRKQVNMFQKVLADDCSHFNSITINTLFKEIKGVLIQAVETSGRGREL